jgi:hypothetical protein
MWYAFKGYNNGKAISASAFDGAELNALGMHGYPTQPLAEAKPNSVNVFQSPVVNAAVNDYNNARDISPTIANNPSSPTAPVIAAGKAAQQAGKQAVSWTASLTDILGKLSTRGFIIRIAEVIIGLGLVIVAVDELAKGTPAANAAHTVAKAALLK